MKRVLLLLGILLTGMSAYAEDNVLQTIEIEPVKDTYNIVLVSDKAVDVKKTVQDSNKINLVLKDIRASKTLNTVYNNVSNVDTVMVEPQGNGINIYFQAENAASATVTFDALAPAITVPNKTAESQKLKLNNPIESYAPIYKEDFETAKTSKLFNKLKARSNVTVANDSFEERNVDDTANKLISYGLVGLLIFATLRLFKKKDSDMKIGLARQSYEQPAMPFGGFNNNIMNTGINPAMPAKPFTTVNYGLNAYRNENRNPYETAPMQFHNPKLQAMANQQYQTAAPQMQSVPVQTNTATLTKPVNKKMTTPVNSAPVNQSNPNVDNLKFLESMTAIYEKSGRHDLARGLKESLNKNNIK